MTTSADISDKIAGEQSITKAQAKSTVERAFKEIVTSAASGAKTSINGVEKFR